MTLSFHHLGKGFFPGGGHCCEAGAGRGRGYNLNVPLKQGLSVAKPCNLHMSLENVDLAGESLWVEQSDA